MLLGKRTRHQIKRTTSMTGINVDASNVKDVVDQHTIISDPPPHSHSPHCNSRYDQRVLAMVSPRNPGSGRSAFSSHAVDCITTAAPFLRSCWLCNRRLSPGCDVYMYWGDTAFCSLECRETQMKKDESKENAIATASKKEDRHATSKTSKAEPLVAA